MDGKNKIEEAHRSMLEKLAKATNHILDEGGSPEQLSMVEQTSSLERACVDLSNLINIMRGMTDDEREEILTIIHGEYCKYCGADLEKISGRCWCQSDD